LFVYRGGMALAEAPEITPSDDRSLEDRVADTVGLLNLAAAELVGLVGEALRTGAWQGAGIRSPEHWVAWHCGVSGARARRLVTSARGLEALPVCRGVFEAGSLSEDQVAVIVRHTDTAHDRQVADLAPSLTVTQLQRVLPSLPRTQPAPDDDRDGDGDSEDSPGEPEGRRRLVRFGWDDDGWWWCSMRLPADEGSLMDKALQAARDREFRARHPHAGDDDRHDPGDVSWVDALVALARAGLDALDPDTAKGRPPGERTQVILHLDLDREAPPRLHLGPALAADLAGYLSCDATCRYLLWRNGTPVAMGRREHTVNPRLRTVIEHRDGGCRVPGCDYSRWLHVHHLVHWEHGGETNPDNLCCLCPVHHRMVHKGVLTVGGDPTDPTDPDGLTFTDQRGRRLAAAHPRPPDPGTQRPTGQWHHPDGGRLNPRWISWN
jgi:hypothetical protein